MKVTDPETRSSFSFLNIVINDSKEIQKRESLNEVLVSHDNFSIFFSAEEISLDALIVFNTM